MSVPRLLMSALLWATAFTSSSASAIEPTGESDKLKFAIAMVQDLRTFSEPGLVGSSDKVFSMPILTPHEIIEERGDWVKVKRSTGTAAGWVEKNLVGVWNSRHGLRPDPMAAAEFKLPAYCSRSDVDAYFRDEAEPCMWFTPAVLDRAKERSPFPVVGIKRGEVMGASKTFLEVLVPTLYSNIAPVEEKVAQASFDRIEMVILIDATGSMADEIRATASALADVVSQVSADSGTDAKFMILAYRDTDDASTTCPPMEVSGGRLGFVSASTAKSFLDTLKACKGGDSSEAIYDAMYHLKDLPVVRGSRRFVVLAGDAPATEVTRGAALDGMRVPEDMSREDVFRTLSSTIGRSTEFVGFLGASASGPRSTRSARTSRSRARASPGPRRRTSAPSSSRR